MISKKAERELAYRCFFSAGVVVLEIAFPHLMSEGKRAKRKPNKALKLSLDFPFPALPLWSEKFKCTLMRLLYLGEECCSFFETL